MEINFEIQTEYGATIPLLPVKTYTASALPLILSVPTSMYGKDVSGVGVSLKNADGVVMTANCNKLAAGIWTTIFGAANFDNYGFVKNGAKFTATLSDGTNTTVITLGIADVEIVASSSQASPGDPSTAYEVKGGEIYVKSRIVQGVQHYVRQNMEYEAEIGWGAVWSGDYVLVNGEFVEVQEG